MRIPYVHAHLDRLSPLWKYSLLMLVFARFNDLVNFYVSTFLVLDTVPQDQLGALYPLQHLALVLGAPMTIAVTVGVKFINVFENRGQRERTRRLTRDLMAFTCLLSCGMWILTALSFPLVAERIRINGQAYMWALILLAVSNAWLPLARGVATGLKQWRRLILVVNVLSPLVRLASMWILLPALALLGYVLAQSLMNLAMLAAFGFGAWKALRIQESGPAEAEDRASSYREDLREMLAFALPIALCVLTFQVQELVESWVIRQRLSAADSAGYYYLHTFGRIPRFLTSALLPFVFILVSDTHEKGKSTRRMHRDTVWLTLVAGAVFAVLLSLATPWFTPLRPAWAGYADYVPLMGAVAFIQTFTSVITVHTAHENGIRAFGYLRLFVPIIAVECGILYGLNLWHLTRSFLDPSLWMAVQEGMVRSLPGTLVLMLGTRLVMSLLVLLSLRPRHRRGRGE